VSFWDRRYVSASQKCVSPLVQVVDFLLFLSLIPNSLLLRNSHFRGKDLGGRTHDSKGSGACSNKGCSGGTSVRGDGAVRPAIPGDDLQRDTQSMPFPLSARTRNPWQHSFFGRNHKQNRKLPFAKRGSRRKSLLLRISTK
jgi:hypothetical protein